MFKEFLGGRETSLGVPRVKNSSRNEKISTIFSKQVDEEERRLEHETEDLLLLGKNFFEGKSLLGDLQVWALTQWVRLVACP